MALKDEAVGRLSMKDLGFFLNLLSVLLVRVFGALSAFLVAYFVGNRLGVEESGVFYFLLSVVSITSAVTRLGFERTLVRFIGQNNHNSYYVVYLALGCVFPFSLSLSLIAIIFSNYVAVNLFSWGDLAQSLRLIGFGVFGLSVLTLMSNALQGLGKPVMSVIILNVFHNILFIVLLVLCDLYSAEGVSSAYAFSVVTTSLFGYFLFLFYRPSASGADHLTRADVFSSSMPLWWVVIMSQFIQWSGQLVSGFLLNAEAVGLLAVSQRVALLISFVLIAINLLVSPKFSNLYHLGRKRELEKLVSMASFFSWCFGLLFVFIMCVFAKDILALFGSGFEEGVAFLYILAFGQLVSVMCGSVGFLLTMTGYEKEMKKIAIRSGIVSIIAAVAMTSWFGATGAAISISFSLIFQNIYAVTSVRRLLGINTLYLFYWRLKID